MCPGGYVVAAASEEGGIVTNGMSYSGRSGPNANAALLVSLHPKDFPHAGPLGGMRWQQELERQAYRACHHYQAPAQRVGDFLRGVPSQHFGAVTPILPSRGRALGPAPSPAPHPHRRPRPGTSCPGAEAVGL